MYRKITFVTGYAHSPKRYFFINWFYCTVLISKFVTLKRKTIKDFAFAIPIQNTVESTSTDNLCAFFSAKVVNPNPHGWAIKRSTFFKRKLSA
jgi:hypothetical protein